MDENKANPPLRREPIVGSAEPGAAVGPEPAGHDIGGVGGQTATGGGGLGTGDAHGDVPGTGPRTGAATGLNDIGPGSGDLGDDAAEDSEERDLSRTEGADPPPGPGASGQRA